MTINYKNLAESINKTKGNGVLIFGDVEVPVHIESISIDSRDAYTTGSVITFDGMFLGEAVKKEDNTFKIEKVTVNGPATIVFKDIVEQYRVTKIKHDLAEYFESLDGHYLQRLVYKELLGI